MNFERLITFSMENRSLDQRQGTTLRARRLWLGIFFGIILLSQYSCNQPADRSSYSGSSTSYARVSVHVDSRTASQQYRSKQRHLNISSLPEPTATALIIAVDEGTPFSENYNTISTWHDKQLVDLTTSTVTLKLPLNTSIQLFEYTFNQTYSLNSLNSSDQPVFTKAILGPFTITGSTTTIELNADLEYALSEPFNTIWKNGAYSIEMEHEDSTVYYSYEFINWQTLASTTYLFDPATREFSEGAPPSSGYELVGTEWVLGGSHAPDSTFERVDHNTYTVYYKNPDFSATLVGLIDLPAQGLEGDFKGGEDDGGDEDPPFMGATDFSPGALGYILEINGQPDSDYRLERIVKSHDCNSTEFSSLSEYIDFHTSSEFTCQNRGDGPCLRFDSYTPGQTSGSISEVIRDNEYNIISNAPAGRWEIATIQSHEMLFFYPDDTAYYHDGSWASFWSLLNGKIWEGSYPATSGAEESMYFVTFNDIAIANYQTYLKSAPAATFTDGDSGDSEDSGDSSCSSQNWGEAIWGNFTWGP
ncbi:MAG: hypothetical protein HN745_08900 [Deltaproteobacteria bacterium]|nr:hypothetical protein [Deltaproteobacteria bacterium]